MLICDLHHGKSDDLLTQLEALLEYLGDGILGCVFILGVHHGVVEIGVKGFAHLTENLDAKTVHDLFQLGHRSVCEGVFAFSEINVDYICQFGNSSGGQNVQLILEEIGGGGHYNAAGGYFTDDNVKNIVTKLKKAIDKYSIKEE